MLCHKEDFPATGKNSHNVGIRVLLCTSSYVLFCAKKLVKAFHFVVFINENYLSTVLDHTMASKAEKGKDGFMRILFEKAVQICYQLVALFHWGLYEGLELIRREAESRDKFFKLAAVIEYSWQVTICLYVLIFSDFWEFPDITEVRNA